MYGFYFFINKTLVPLAKGDNYLGSVLKFT